MKLKETLGLRAFAWWQIPLIFFCRPVVLALDDQRAVVKIALRRRTKNHLGSMYFGVLAVGADLAGGLIGMDQIRKSGHKLSLVFKDFKADFLKRPEADVHFTCTDGPAIRALIQKAVASGERENAPMRIIATCPKKFGTDPVADMTLTLSVKVKKRG